ncbi:hypothetical protein EVAR_98908_1 [Eumeta japonica]|uniref:Uncharacterized protein n=1 Tax=Eumeta variegata TaxID=151549 RepID=A0A4C1Y687_EUMVA|nr:hypothetical protein EVAR_98908_1 [Eumeta japonica]
MQPIRGCYLKEYEYALRMDELPLKCLLQADEPVILAPSACELWAMVTKMNCFVKNRCMKVNLREAKGSVTKWQKQNPYSFVMSVRPGRRFYWANCYTLSSSMLMGLIAVFAVPSILVILVGSRRSSSTYTAYKRYLSTLLHVQAWLEHELKPGSTLVFAFRFSTFTRNFFFILGPFVRRTTMRGAREHVVTAAHGRPEELPAGFRPLGQE